MPSDTLPPVALALRRLRDKAGLTQAALAEASGVKRAMINEVEAGRKTPSLGTMELLADALDVSLDQLTGRAK